MPRRIALWSLSVTAACLPLYVVRWHLGPLPTTFLENLILLTGAAWLFSLWSERRLPAWRTPYNIPIAVLLIAGVISVVDAPSQVAALGIYRAYFLEAIAMYFIAVDLLRTPDDIRRFLLVAAAGSAAMAVGQIVLFAIAAANHTLQLGDAPSFLNTSANAVSMYLEPPLALALGFAVFASRPLERWIGAGLLALFTVANVLTLSRAGYLAMAVLGVLTVLSLRSARWQLWATGAMAVIGLITLEIPFVNARLLDLAHSVANRETLYNSTLRMLGDRPLTGAGLSGYAARIEPYRPPNQLLHIYPHDMWLTVWSELGLLGLIAFAVIFFALLWHAMRAFRGSDGFYRPLLWGVIGALALYTIHGLFDSPYWKNDLSVEFWLLAALQVIAVRQTRASPAPGAR